jgi:hypothetical protein
MFMFMSEVKKPEQQFTVSATRDGGLIAAPPTVNNDAADSTSDGGSIRIPQVDTTLGADFGAEISDTDRAFASEREPVAGFLVYGYSGDVVEKWFVINDVKTKQADPELDRRIQKELRSLKFKPVVQAFVEYKRLFGNTLVVGSFDDAEELPDLAKELPKSAHLQKLAVFPKISYSVFEKERNQKSLRYGLPTIYQVQNGEQTFYVHYTRCFEYIGKSVLDLIWDDLTCGRNIRWGVGQWVFRVGGGFAVVKFPKEWSPDGTTKLVTTPKKIQEWSTASSWSNITHRTYIGIINEVMDFKFEGAAGATLNPIPFFDTNLKQISIATGIPKSILEGAEAGALTGSEKNDQQYYKKISGDQSKLEDLLRWVIDQVMRETRSPSAQMADGVKSAGSVLKRMLRKVAPAVVHDAEPEIEYEIEWANAFELSALDESRVELNRVQANVQKLQYCTVDEVREGDGKKPLPEGEGEVVLSLKAPATNQFSMQPQQQIPSGSNTQDAAASTPSLGALLQPLLKAVMEGTMTREVAAEKGTAMIDYFAELERQRALDYNRVKFNKPSLTLSPEQEQELSDQRESDIKDFLSLLLKAEKLWQAQQP